MKVIIAHWERDLRFVTGDWWTAMKERDRWSVRHDPWTAENPVAAMECGFMTGGDTRVPLPECHGKERVGEDFG